MRGLEVGECGSGSVYLVAFLAFFKSVCKNTTLCFIQNIHQNPQFYAGGRGFYAKKLHKITTPENMYFRAFLVAFWGLPWFTLSIGSSSLPNNY